MSASRVSHFSVMLATLGREWLSHRVNRFLYLHLALMASIGLLALLAPAAAASQGAVWWLLNGVLYVASLSALLLGLSSAQAETDEFPVLFTHPISLGAWVAGKSLGLFCVVVPAALLLIAPTIVTAGISSLLLGAAAAAALMSFLMALIGLAVGLWVEDAVRGLILAVSVWCVMLFGVDLLLIAIGGAPWVQRQPFAWVAALMLSPLDAFRITLLFVVEKAAFSSSEVRGLARWWLDHAVLWFGLCLFVWCVATTALAVLGAARRRNC